MLTIKLMDKRFLFHGHGVSEPIGLEYIASRIDEFCKSLNFKSHIELEAVLLNDIKVSLISATTAEWPSALSINSYAKNQGNITIVGGYHISGNYKNEKELTFDYIVIGEGENVIIGILSDILSGHAYINKSQEPKIIYALPIQDLDDLPFPIRKESFLGNYMIHDLMFPAPSRQKNTSIILGSRGCNYNCSFCASATIWGSGIRVRKIDNIISEINEIQSKFKSNTFVFIDQSLGQKEEWTINLCKAIVENDIKLNWYHQSNININQELLPIMAEAGCSKIGFGVEGISPTAINKIKPINPISLEQINQLFEACNQYGIIVKAYLILGFPWETTEIVNEYFEFLPKLKANMVKISFFTPFPGTKDWNIYSDNLVTKDWSKFDTVQMPVVINPNISIEEYFIIRQNLFHVFYSSKEYKSTCQELLIKYPHYRQSYIEFYDYLKEFSMLPAELEFEEWIPDRVIHQ
jgi:anaerobic magnesium-protoporphyrin IX monomethyl ester cyclase